MPRALCLLAAFVASACSSSSGAGPDGSEPNGSEPSASQPNGTGPNASEAVVDEPITFYGHIAPIAARHCTGCHQPGSIAPFSLLDYASAEPYAGAIAAATAAREMPPMPVDNAGSCNTYSNARWLSESEIATFGAWFAQGARAGDPALAPRAPAALGGLERVDAELGMAAEYLPSHRDPRQHDDYRCFVLPAASSSDTFVTGYEVIPGDTRVVHHVIAFQPRSDAAAARARELDAGEAGEGYTCFGGSGVDADLFAGWAPGAGPTHLPEGTGVALSGGRDLILQVHYNLMKGAFPDRTRVQLSLSSSVEQPGLYAVMADRGLVLQPGQRDAVTSRRIELGLPVPVTVYGVLPHMHELGQTLRLELESGAETSCLVAVDRWNFHWQNAWWYDTPLTFAGVDALSIRCGYDTRPRSEVVTWGEGTADEMCLSYFYVTSPALGLLRR